MIDAEALGDVLAAQWAGAQGLGKIPDNFTIGSHEPAWASASTPLAVSQPTPWLVAHLSPI